MTEIEVVNDQVEVINTNYNDYSDEYNTTLLNPGRCKDSNIKEFESKFKLSNKEYKNSDTSSSDNEEEYYDNSGFDFDESDFLMEGNNTPSFPSFTNDTCIMFSNSSLTVSDVLLMIKAIELKFGVTRDMFNSLLNFVRILAGPAFENWDYSPYLFSQTVTRQ